MDELGEALEDVSLLRPSVCAFLRAMAASRCSFLEGHFEMLKRRQAFLKVVVFEIEVEESLERLVGEPDESSQRSQKSYVWSTRYD